MSAPDIRKVERTISRRIFIVLLVAIPAEGIVKAQAPTPCPTGSVAAVASGMLNAVCERDKLPAATGSLWRFEGPRNQVSDPSVSNKGITSGRINEIAVHPTNPLIIYATAPTGGVWKTTNGGQTWASRSQGWPIQNATAIAIDPSNANRVFAGTGDYKRLDHVEPFSVGIMRSLDGGLTWANFGATQMADYVVSRIVVDPRSGSQKVLAATGRGSRLPGGHIFRSANGGADWTGTVVDNFGNSLPDANWDDLFFDGNNFWAAATQRKDVDAATPGRDESGLLYKSPDGITWTKVIVTTSDYNLGAAARHPDVIKIAQQGSLLFIAVFEGGNARVFFTTTSGASWSERTSSLQFSVGGSPWAHAAFCATQDFLYLGGSSMFRGGFIEGAGFAFVSIPNPIHEDIQCAVRDPAQTNAVLIATDGGIYRYSNVSDTTTSLSATLGVTQVFRMDVHQRDGGLIAIGSQDLGSSVSFAANNGDLRQPPSWAVVQTGDGRSNVFRQDNTERVYMSNGDSRIRRYDGTNAVNVLGTAAPDSEAPLLFNNDTLFHADTQFWRLTNPESKNENNADWTPTNFLSPCPPTCQTQRIQALANCPSNKQTVYAGSNLGEVYVSDNSGATWASVDSAGQPLGLGLPLNGPIWAIAPSPTNCHDVLVGVGYEGNTFPVPDFSIRKGTNFFIPGDRLFRRADVLNAGNPWVGAHGTGATPLPQAPVFAIARFPGAPDTNWFVATDVGVFRTSNAGASWSNATLPLGLPNTLVRDLRFSDDGLTLYAGTFGRGVWSMDIFPPTGFFGVRGIVTQAGRAINGATVQVTGAGRIKRFLKNKIASGLSFTSAPIEVPETATITTAAATVRVSGTVSLPLLASLILTTQGPFGSSETAFPLMLSRTIAPNISEFVLTPGAVSLLHGRATTGNWSFRFTGFSPLSLVSGSIDFQFGTGISGPTGPDGEFTLEYLASGPHIVSTAGVAPISLNLQSNRTDLDLRQPSVGEFTLEPVQSTARVGDEISYNLTYTITEGRSWRDLSTVQLRFRDPQGTILWVAFNPAKGTFNLIHPETGGSGPDFAPGRPNRLETSAATVYLADTSFTPNVPDPSSVTLVLGLSFKPTAANRTYQIEVIAKDALGNSQGPEPAGTLSIIK
jgi:hypothetical protein